MTKTKRSIYARRMLDPELQALMVLGANIKWWEIPEFDETMFTKMILIIHSDNLIESTDNLITLTSIFELEYILHNNLNNRAIINMSKEKIYENQEDWVKYGLIMRGLLFLCDKHVNFNKAKPLLFNDKSLMSIKCDVDIPDFKNITQAVTWINGNIKEAAYYTDLFGYDTSRSSDEELKDIFDREYKHYQMAYYKREKNGNELVIMTYGEMDRIV